jgi:glycerol-3-phosphate dehydrogenase
MKHVDAVVIGAGIQGAGIAQVLAAAGYSVIVLEQTAVAAATSSASSKLIHGGLRYLESAQFSLVRKSLKERGRLLNNAPDLVKLVPFYIPLYQDSKRKPWQIFAGLSLYAILGGLGRSARFKRISKQYYKNLNIKKEGLRAVYQYLDAQTDDIQLTQAVMYSAIQLGAELICPAQFISAHSTDSHVRLKYMLNTKEYILTSQVLINATGPWVNQVLNKITPHTDGLEIDLIQGSHLLLDVPAFNGIYYVEAPQDSRAVFVMPWKGKCLIGTTETLHKGNPNETQVTDEEINYLLTVFKHYFPGENTKVLEVMSGLRVLPANKTGENSSAFNRPRDTILHQSAKNILSVYGGKLTAYRSTAEDVLHAVANRLPNAVTKADTKTIKLQKVEPSVFPHGIQHE